MPLYTYKCESCGVTEDEHRSIVERDLPLKCQQRGCWGMMTRVPTAASFTVQGFNAKNGYSKS